MSYSQSTWKTWLHLIRHNKVGFLGFLGVLFFILLSFVGPYFIPLDTETKIDQIYQPPSSEHWLGTDSEGRDIFSQIVHGGRDVLMVAFLAGLMSTGIAVVLGSLSALAGGWVDQAIMGLADIVLTIPHFPLLAVLAGLVRLDNYVYLAVILAALAWPSLARAIRAQVLSLRERDFVEAARTLDLGTRHIILREILPNMVSYIVINLIFAMTSAIYAQVGLVFLGLVPFSGQNWGVMLSLAWTRGAIFYKNSFWYIMAPVLAIVLFQLSLVSFARLLEEIFDPRLRAVG
ncbi:MAG: ABC transporter permease [Chloroflexi bacterium]|nr:ABC transporter permease [Chloroflexota bacterium]